MSQKSYDGKPSLYLIPTPIGNMDDITLRAIKILQEVEVVFSEDTRVTGLLLSHLNIKKKMIANHEHNEDKNKEKLIDYLNRGFNIGLVSDRGTPIISDPGYGLAMHAIEKGYNVISLPGATALIPALITSGIKTQPFYFYGFLNSKSSKRIKELETLKEIDATLIFYEAPHRITETLKNMLEVLGNRKASISREISKKFEEIYRGNLDDIIVQTVDIKGEIVIIVDGNYKEKNYDNLTLDEHIKYYMVKGMSQMDAIKQVAKDRGVAKNSIYNAIHGK